MNTSRLSRAWLIRKSSAALLVSSVLAGVASAMCTAPVSPKSRSETECSASLAGTDPSRIPTSLEAAAALLVECMPAAEHERVGAETESAYGNRVHMGSGLTLRNAWLHEASSPLRKNLIQRGFAYPEDMSSALFAAVWHQIHALPFDVEVRAKCVRAWNAESVRLMNSVPAGSQIPATGFMCTDDQSVEAGRAQWLLVK